MLKTCLILSYIIPGRDRKARPSLAQQRSSLVAIRNRRFAHAWRQEILWQVLRRCHRPHQHQTAAMYHAKGSAAVGRRGAHRGRFRKGAGT